MKRFLLPLLVFLGGHAVALAQVSPDSATEHRMRWFEDAKLGIFIHWGIYSVYGIDESWSFYNGYLPYDEYMKQLKGFTAAHYDPAAWAKLFKAAGARYAVLTSKHHDGVALWPTRCSHLNVVERTPAGRDLVGPFCRAMRKEGLKVGLYFSLLDWSHPDYPHFTRKKDRYDPRADSTRWHHFLKFVRCQLRELCTHYEPDLLWFDGDWDYPASMWQARELRVWIDRMLPSVVVNSRLAGYGDYATPEQGLPIFRPKDRWWELCMTINDSWGYQPHDTNYKTPDEVIRIFVDCLSLGGNLLLDVGPKPDGTIPAEQAKVLRELGRWIHKHEAAVYGVRAGIPKDYFYGPSALSKDQRTLYLYLTCKPAGPVLVKGLRNKVNRIWVVGKGTKLKWRVLMKPYWSRYPGILSIEVPEDVLDPQVTVLAVLLDGPIQLYEPKR